MSELSFDEKNEYIKEDPAYGRIVCRCEEVTEGEIRDALENN
ncbi:MAG: (2Fe-2S)-binding protein, partial [Clostridia bacterium]|nr:(2Fe-2S)-binding protein [Clostridia bacterium]